MTQEEYYEHIDFSKLKKKMISEGYNANTLSKALGGVMTNVTIKNSFNKKAIMSLKNLVTLAAFFECSVNDLVEFTGYEIKPEFNKPFIPREPDPDYHLTFAPLFDYLKEKYGDNYKAEFENLCDRVEPLEISEVTVGHLREYHKIVEEKKKSGEIKGNNPRSRKWQGGINSARRSQIRNDLEIRIQMLYNLCKELGCTPGDIVTYR